MVEYLSRYSDKMPSLIIVSIEQKHRSRDMTPIKLLDNPDTGNAEIFWQFINSELKPYVDSNFRTDTFDIIWGYSLSGLFAMYTFMNHPETFDAYIASSPSLWWGDNYLLNKTDMFLKNHKKLSNYLFFSIGELERDAVQNYYKVFKSKIEKNAPEGLSYKFMIINNENHGTICIPSTYCGLSEIFNIKNK